MPVSSNEKLYGGVCKRLCGGVQAAMQWVAHKILVSAPGLDFELIRTWLGLGLRGLGTKVMGL